MNPKVRLGLLLGLVFVLGASAGVAGSHVMMTRRVHRMLEASPQEAHDRRIVAVLERKLDLSFEQKAKVEQIFDAHRSEFEDLRRAQEPSFEALRERVHGEIRATLTENQKAAFDRFEREMDERRRRHPFGPPGGGPGLPPPGR